MTQLNEAARNVVNEISGNLKKNYLKAAIEDLQWFAGADQYHGLSDREIAEWEKRKKNVNKMIDKLMAKK